MEIKMHFYLQVAWVDVKINHAYNAISPVAKAWVRIWNMISHKYIILTGGIFDYLRGYL